VTEFFRYPHTPHIAWLAEGHPRDDKVLSPTEATLFLAGEVVVEEKLDGANLGFSIGPGGGLRAQNRGQYLLAPFTGQFARLDAWLTVHQDRLFDMLTESLIVFGEWCAARHSLDYDRLPDWWLMFDVYDREAKQFWSTQRRDQLASAMLVAEVPCLHQGRIGLAQLQGWVTGQASSFREGPVEGLVVRREDSLWLQQRAKLVRPGFTQGIDQHWRERPLAWNRVCAPVHD
jgi:ATP-dependent RNA circularization protein (DNA/RNA ligase family)